MARKKYRFQVHIEIVELLNVALKNEYIFIKIRQKKGKFNYLTSKEEVQDHKVVWREKFSFECKTTAPASTGVLDGCYLRFSIRKETRHGLQKLGYVDINLSEFAGCGKQNCKYLLEGYTSSTRLDNSILKFFIDMQLISGDPLFKRHTISNEDITNEQMMANQTYHRPCQDGIRNSLTLNTYTDSTRVNNDVAINEIIEQNLRFASTQPQSHKGLSLHDI